MSVSQNTNIAYSLNQPLSEIFPRPIVSLRSPLSTDKAQIGTVWVNKTLNDAWVLTSIVNNSASWLGIGGGSGSFTDLTVTGNADIGTSAGAIVNIGNDLGATAVTINSGSAPIAITSFSGDITVSGDNVEIGATGDMDFYGIATSNFTLGAPTTTGTITIGGTAQTGAITIGGGTGAQTLNLGTGGTGIKTVNIATGAVANVTTIGTTTASSTLTLRTPTGTPVTASNGLTATVGNITATNGNVVLSTAATYVQLPGPVKIMSGAGAPSNGLAVNVGDMYINTTAATSATRLYIATAASTWTNVTCAA